MLESKDFLHAEAHVLDIIELLNQFLQSSEEINKDNINFNVLLPAICWHDIWKSQREQTTNLLKFKFEQEWDGIGSALVFKQYAQKNNISPKLAKEILAAVLRHDGGILSKLKGSRKSLESKILHDLDSLDFWSKKRLNQMKKQYLNDEEKFHNPKRIPVANWMLNKLSKRVNRYHFKWCTEEFQQRKKYILKEGNRIIEKNIKK